MNVLIAPTGIADRAFVAEPPTDAESRTVEATDNPELPVALATPVRPKGNWTLAIDFGTTFTVAAVLTPDGTARLVDIEGDGSSKMPSSAVLTDDGTLVVGRAAVNQSVLYPDRFEPTPKRLIGQGSVLMGEELISVVDLVAAVLRQAVDEACRQQGGTEPAVVRLTHPAKWAASRLDLLQRAGDAAGLSAVELVAEPVAAASRIGAATVEIGRRIAVYDFGGGTFDAAVLVRTPDGFHVAGDPGGRDPLGGEDIDERILTHLGAGPLGATPEWAALVGSPEPRWRRLRAELRRRVREAKEELSKSVVSTIWIPGLERDYQFTRRELDALIEEDVAATLDELESTMAAADTDVADLAGIYLVGGSSRIALVSDMIRERFGVEPAHFEDPKATVALGAATFRAGSAAIGSGSRVRLGAAAIGRPGPQPRVEHWLSGADAVTLVHSVPSRWASVEEFALDAQQRAHQAGRPFGPPAWGHALGRSGAVLLTTADTNGDIQVHSFQVVGGWAVHANWPAADSSTIATCRLVDANPLDCTRPPLVRSGTAFSEAITVSAGLVGNVFDSTVTGRLHDLRADENEHWHELFLARIVQQHPGMRAESLQSDTFASGEPCRVARLRRRGLRAWCWYGIVGGHGLSVTLESKAPISIGTATRIRDAVQTFA